MNKVDFVAAVAEKAGISKKDAGNAVGDAIDGITDGVDDVVNGVTEGIDDMTDSVTGSSNTGSPANGNTRASASPSVSPVKK